MTRESTAITMKKPHVVLLGAGASLAAFSEGDAEGRKLPVMDNFIDTVDGLAAYLNSENINHDGNIENLYSQLANSGGYSGQVREIEQIIHDYFSQLKIPEHPTLYDHLLLCLRAKDIVATFNWDPFLYNAFCRVGRIVGLQYLPRLAFLHGNVGIGYCDAPCHNPMMIGPSGVRCSCGDMFKKNPLLYPIHEKDYAKDAVIRASWHDLRICLEHAYIFTIFGYSAPASDVEAVALMKEAWGHRDQRVLEQIEVIDIVNSDVVEKNWADFICRDHVMTWDSFYKSSLARAPRRSCDAFWDMSMDLMPRHEIPIDTAASWDDLTTWVAPYLDVEKVDDEA